MHPKVSVVLESKWDPNQPCKSSNSVALVHCKCQELERQRALYSPAQGDGGRSRGGHPTMFSATTPGKVLKRACLNGKTPERKTLFESPLHAVLEGDASLKDAERASGSLGQTGEAPDEVFSLRMENQRLQDENCALANQLKELTLKLSEAETQPGFDESLESANQQVGDESARKRLARMVKPRSDGRHGN